MYKYNNNLLPCVFRQLIFTAIDKLQYMDIAQEQQQKITLFT